MLPRARGGDRALAVVVGGMTVASGLGVPIGTALGAVTDWRGTMWFVAALGAVAALGIIALLPAVPTPPAIGLRRRLAPLRDSVVTTDLLTTLLVMTGVLTVYTYVSLVYDRATGGNGTTLAVLLFGAGSLTDKLGSRVVINLAMVIGAINFAMLPLPSSESGRTDFRSIEVLVGVGYASCLVSRLWSLSYLERRREPSVIKKSWMPKYWPTTKRE